MDVQPWGLDVTVYCSHGCGRQGCARVVVLRWLRVSMWLWRQSCIWGSVCDDVWSRCWRGWGKAKPSSLFSRPESHSPLPPRLEAVSQPGPQQCCPTPSSSRAPLLYIQPILAASRTWLPALCQVSGSSSRFILRTRWAPHGQCCDPDIKPATGGGHPRAQASCCLGWGDRYQTWSCSHLGTNFRVGCESRAPLPFQRGRCL